MAKQTVPPLPLPKNWPLRVRSAAVHAIAHAPIILLHFRWSTTLAPLQVYQSGQELLARTSLLLVIP